MAEQIKIIESEGVLNVCKEPSATGQTKVPEELMEKEK